MDTVKKMGNKPVHPYYSGPVLHEEKPNIPMSTLPLFQSLQRAAQRGKQSCSFSHLISPTGAQIWVPPPPSSLGQNLLQVWVWNRVRMSLIILQTRGFLQKGLILFPSTALNQKRGAVLVGRWKYVWWQDTSCCARAVNEFNPLDIQGSVLCMLEFCCSAFIV